jgi:hypothetical protein
VPPFFLAVASSVKRSGEMSMHTVDIEPGIEGTAVTFTSFAVPPRDEKRRQH